MRKFLPLQAAMLLALSSASAFAADAVVSEPAPVAASFSWTGAYIGAYAGGAFAQNKLKNLSGSTDVNLSPSGFTGGVYAGYNVQFDPLVLGAEAEIGYDGWRAGGEFLNSSFKPRHAESRGTYIGRVRARGGYAVDNLLVFLAGGVSFGQDKVTQSNANVGDSLTRSLVGWNIGAGAEYAFTSNWIGRFEYIHDAFGREDYGFKDLPHGFADREVKLSNNTVRVGLEYKF